MNLIFLFILSREESIKIINSSCDSVNMYNPHIRRILAKGEGDRMINPIGEAQRLEMRQAASLYTDPEGKVPEAECH